MGVGLLVSICDLLIDLLVSHHSFHKVLSVPQITTTTCGCFLFLDFTLVGNGLYFFYNMSQNNHRPISIVSVIFRTVEFSCFHFRTVLCCVIIRFSLFP